MFVAKPLGAWLAVMRAREVGESWKRSGLFTVAAVSMLFALCSKEIALMWLVLFLLHLFVFESSQSWPVRFKMLGGVVVVFGIYFGLHSDIANRYFDF